MGTVFSTMGAHPTANRPANALTHIGPILRIVLIFGHLLQFGPFTRRLTDAI